MLFNKKWKTLERVPVPGVVEEIVKFINERGEAVIHIGTDSQAADAKSIDFVTCIGLVQPGKGGRCLYTTTTLDRSKVGRLHQKLLTETQLTIELGLELMERFEDVKFIVHADVNPNPDHRSNKHINEVVGYILGMGFTEVLVKPDAWLSSHAADHAVKHKNAR